MPAWFDDAYLSTCILSYATELFVEVLVSLSPQSQNYSSYKLRTTHKSLVGIAPNGCITFLLCRNCLLGQSVAAGFRGKLAFLICWSWCHLESQSWQIDGLKYKIYAQICSWRYFHFEMSLEHWAKCKGYWADCLFTDPCGASVWSSQAHLSDLARCDSLVRRRAW